MDKVRQTRQAETKQYRQKDETRQRQNKADRDKTRQTRGQSKTKQTGRQKKTELVVFTLTHLHSRKKGMSTLPFMST